MAASPEKLDEAQYFGFPDAAREGAKSIIPDHVRRSFEDSIKCGDRETGTFVIVGIKGSGKTALRRYLESRDRIPTWNLDSDHPDLTMDVREMQGSSGVLKNGIAFRLLSTFANQLLKRPESFGLPKREPKAIRDALGKAGAVLRGVFEDVTLDLTLPLLRVNLGRIFHSDASAVVREANENLVKGIIAELKGVKAYVMIDDVDDIFTGSERTPLFVEGLVRAVEDMNDLAGAKIHTLLFLKAGVFRAWFERQREFDKVAHRIQEISWDDSSLVELIARRIARIRSIAVPDGPIDDPERLWAHEFDWSGEPSFAAFRERFTRLCMSGPRDMIALANAAKKEVAGGERITAAHLAKIVRSYSERKLFGINADFGSVYEDISQFTEMVFQGCTSPMSGEDAAAWIEEHGVVNKRVFDRFQKFDWYSAASNKRLLAMMFEVGVLGRVLENGSAEYAIQRSGAVAGELLDSTVVVHPALQPYLSVRPAPLPAPRPPSPKKGRRRE